MNSSAGSPDLKKCEQCGTDVSSEGCPDCDISVASVVSAELVSVDSTRARQSWREMMDRRWVVLALLFGATGVLGMPLLWMSRGFRLPGKIVYSILITLYTALLLWITWSICHHVWEQIQKVYE